MKEQVKVNKENNEENFQSLLSEMKELLSHKRELTKDEFFPFFLAYEWTKSGNETRAEQILQKETFPRFPEAMPKRELEDRIHSYFAKKLIEEGRVPQAEYWMKKVRSSREKGEVFTELAFHFLKQKEYEKVFEIVESLNDPYFKSQILLLLIHEYEKEGKIEEMKEILGKIPNAYHKRESEKILIQTLAQKGQWDEIDTYLEKKDPLEKLPLYPQIAPTFYLHGKKEEYRKILHEMNSFDQNLVRKKIAETLVREKKFSELESFLKEDPNFQYGDTVHKTVIHSLTQQGETERAKREIEKIKDESARNVAKMIFIESLQGKRGKEELLRMRKEESDAKVQETISKQLASILIHEGDEEEAKKEMEKVRDPHALNSLYAQLARKSVERDGIYGWKKSLHYRKKIEGEETAKINVRVATIEKATRDFFEKQKRLLEKIRSLDTSQVEIGDTVKTAEDVFALLEMIREKSLSKRISEDEKEQWKKVLRDIYHYGKGDTNEETLVRTSSGGDPFSVRMIARALSFAGRENSDALFELWNRVQVQDGKEGILSVRVLRELAREDLERGGSLIFRILQSPNLEERRFTYFNKLLTSEGYITENVLVLLETKEGRSFLKELIRRYPEQYSNTIDTIVSLGFDVSNERNRKIVFKGIEELGAVTPNLFKKYLSFESEDERKQFTEKMKSLYSHFFENRNIEELVEEDERSILAELIYSAYKPKNMTLSQVEELLQRVRDRSKDIAPYLHEEKGIFPFSLNRIRYEIKEGEKLNSELYKKLQEIDRAMTRHSLESRENAPAEFPHVLKKLAKGTSDLSPHELGTLLKIMGNFPFKTRTFNEKPHQTLTQLVNYFTVYFQDTYPESLTRTLENNENLRENIHRILSNPKRRETLTKVFRIKGKEGEEKDEIELITGALAYVLEKRIVGELRKELKKFEAKRGENDYGKRVEAFISKNQGSFFAKASAGICTAKDVWLWDQENHFHINIVEERERVIGNVQAYLIEDPQRPGEKSLLLRGFNPNESILRSGISPESFVESVFNLARKFQEKNHLANVYITEQGRFHALTNRSEVTRVLKPYMKNPIDYPMQIAQDAKIKKIYQIS